VLLVDRVQGAGCRVQGAGCRVKSAGGQGEHLLSVHEAPLLKDLTHAHAIPILPQHHLLLLHPPPPTPRGQRHGEDGVMQRHHFLLFAAGRCRSYSSTDSGSTIGGRRAGPARGCFPTCHARELVAVAADEQSGTNRAKRDVCMRVCMCVCVYACVYECVYVCVCVCEGPDRSREGRRARGSCAPLPL